MAWQALSWAHQWQAREEWRVQLAHVVCLAHPDVVSLPSSGLGGFGGRHDEPDRHPYQLSVVVSRRRRQYFRGEGKGAMGRKKKKVIR